MNAFIQVYNSQIRVQLTLLNADNQIITKESETELKIPTYSLNIISLILKQEQYWPPQQAVGAMKDQGRNGQTQWS